jgi:hypothetical protein
MGHIITKHIDTDGKYKKLSDELGITFEPNTQYTMQVIGEFYYQLNADTPTQLGFFRNNDKEFGFTPVDGEDLWVRTEGATFTVAK